MNSFCSWRNAVLVTAILFSHSVLGEVSCPYDHNAEWPSVPEMVCQSSEPPTGAALIQDDSPSSHPDCVHHDSDPDGDGWGWENERSCRVPSRSFFCKSADSDPDGDGWGWENYRSCIVAVAKKLEPPVCESSASDPDGDGWGYENGLSCTVASATTTPTEAAPTEPPGASVPACSADVADPDGDGWGYENQRSCLIIEAKRAVDVVFQQDFEQTPVGTYGAEQLNQDWDNPLWHLGFVQGRVHILPEPARGNVMRVTYPANKYGSSGAAAFLSDLEFGVDIPGSYEELYLSYDVKFGEGFEFVKGGKLPGLCGYNNNSVPVKGCNTGGGFPSGYDGWSARGMWREDGVLENYVYHSAQENYYGDDLFWKTDAEPGQWHRIQHRVVLNTPNVSNGVLEAWVDGQRVLSIDNLMYRKTADIGINLFYFSTFFGGNDASWAPAKDQYVFFDNFSITTQRERLVVGRALSLSDDATQQVPTTGGGGVFGVIGVLIGLLIACFRSSTTVGGRQLRVLITF